MLFNSLEFLLFLPLTFAVYWWMGSSHRRWQNVWLVVASYVFYGWWDWRFLLLIALTSACSYASGRLMELERWRRTVCGANIVLNLLVLGVFKYYGFFVENLDILLSAAGIHLDWATLNVVLPVGISFYTFQALSYTIDVYRRQVKPTHDAVDFFAYICFFPQLVAGPIERATQLLPQFQKRRQFDYAQAVDGLRQMLWGFVKKVVVADSCALAVNECWEHLNELPVLSLLMVAVLFTFQIYGDFSGYSDIAIGCARLFGFRLMRNFQLPYFADSVADFWRRWHISLMTWLRDYVYIPMGGNRCGRVRRMVNVLTTFLVSGLWHGANWTFVLWGLYHGVLTLLFRRPLRGVRVVSMILTFVLVVAGWVLFRAETVGQAAEFFGGLLSHPLGRLAEVNGKFALFWAVLMMGAEWLQRKKEHCLQLPEQGPCSHRWVRWGLYWLLLTTIGAHLGAQQTFIYFQF